MRIYNPPLSYNPPQSPFRKGGGIGRNSIFSYTPSFFKGELSSSISPFSKGGLRGIIKCSKILPFLKGFTAVPSFSTGGEALSSFRKGGLGWIIGILFFLSAPAQAQILTVYSDQGFSGNYTGCAGGPLCTWPEGAAFDSLFTGETAPEGTKVFRTSHSSWAGYGVFYNAAQDFSAYAGGELRFWAKTDNCNVKIEIKPWGSAPQTNRLLSSLGCVANTWQLYQTPLSNLISAVNSIEAPFMITSNVGATYFVDQVRWTAPAVTSPWFDVKLKRRTDNVVVSSLTWSNVTLPAGWVAADQYIELSIDPNVTPWGLQIYTDNKAADANPQYTGTGNPVGLVEVELPARVLPLCWRMVDVTTTTLTIIEAPKPEAPSEHYLYSQELGSGFRCFLWMMDQQTTGFVNGSEAVTIWDERGIHFAEGANFGAANPPNYLYIGANFANAHSPRTYRTTTLRVEFFTE